MTTTDNSSHNLIFELAHTGVKSWGTGISNTVHLIEYMQLVFFSAPRQHSLSTTDSVP